MHRWLTVIFSREMLKLAEFFLAMYGGMWLWYLVWSEKYKPWPGLFPLIGRLLPGARIEALEKQVDELGADASMYRLRQAARGGAAKPE